MTLSRGIWFEHLCLDEIQSRGCNIFILFLTFRGSRSQNISEVFVNQRGTVKQNGYPGGGGEGEDQPLSSNRAFLPLQLMLL